ncbi:transcription cofactor vestigial-like protein 3 [Salmo salar]|uniref:Transcription cofactor vestigial-like protein 3 n=1 Tax=Salmo salar TaxID=8030 RepID=A0ABM3DPV2_SALSA|nr:transcription cofactor vestigial-like protein 3 [Salmo salar]
MSCLDVMFYQSYGAHYVPASSAAAAAAYNAAYYHHHQHQQQKKLGVYSRMQQDSEEQQCPGGRQQQQRGGGGGDWLGSSGSNGAWGKDSQPAEAEYLSSRCVLFTYFHGDIGDVVDEHFSRALSQTSAFTGENKSSRTTPMHTSASVGLWKDSVSLSEAQCGSLSSSLWGGGYPSQTSPCLSVHPDFSPSPAAFHAPDGALWTGHVLPQPSLPPTASLPDPWAYSRNPQTSASYTHAHNVYTHTHPHTHMHPHHTHPVIHPHLSHGPGLDPRFSPLLLPGVKTQSPLAHSPAGHSTHSNTHSSQSPGIHSGVKIEVEQASPNLPTLTPSAWPATLHTPLDIYDSGLDQDKVNTVWF